MKIPHFPTLNQRWTFLYGLWIFLLSGALANVVGPPGVIQVIRLKSLSQNKSQELAQIQDEVKKLQTETLALEKSSYYQEREARKVLGYAAKDEILFDFVR